MTIARWSAKFDDVLKAKVNGDLTIAHQYMARILENTGEKIDALGRSAIYRDVIGTGDARAVAVLLEEKRAGLGLDFLHVVDRDGRGVAAAPAGAKPFADPREPVLSAALGGAGLTAIEIFDKDQLGAISPVLAERAQLPLIATPNAVPTDRETETRGMVVYSAAPAPGLAGNGALVGGILLNQNLVFIDTINDLVYRSASLPEGSREQRPCFSTTCASARTCACSRTGVRLEPGFRRPCAKRFWAKGRCGSTSAFVVNDWYISAYEPIVDSHGKRVGMLYVGFLERPFFEAKYVTLVTILGAFLLVALASVPLFLRWAGSIFRPLEHMTETIARVEAGELGARTALRRRVTRSVVSRFTSTICLTSSSSGTGSCVPGMTSLTHGSLPAPKIWKPPTGSSRRRPDSSSCPRNWLPSARLPPVSRMRSTIPSP